MMVMVLHAYFMENCSVIALQSITSESKTHLTEFMTPICNFIKVLFFLHMESNGLFEPKFCTCHDSTAVITCKLLAQMDGCYLVESEMRFILIKIMGSLVINGNAPLPRIMTAPTPLGKLAPCVFRIFLWWIGKWRNSDITVYAEQFIQS